MEKNKYTQLSDAELLEAKKKLKRSKITASVIIGALAGVFGYGMVGWIMNPDRKLGFLIPMAIPIFIIYKIVTTPNDHKDLENELKLRGLNS